MMMIESADISHFFPFLCAPCLLLLWVLDPYPGQRMYGMEGCGWHHPYHHHHHDKAIDDSTDLNDDDDAAFLNQAELDRSPTTIGEA